MNSCEICHSKDLKTVYEGPVRAGKFGQSADGFKIVRCLQCSSEGLSPHPENYLAAYKDGSYRRDYDASAEVRAYFELHGKEQKLKLELTGVKNFEGKTVADIGCGAGAFLDAIKGVAKKTLAVEPMEAYYQHLKSKFTEVYSSDEEFGEKVRGQVDVATAFAVVEHVASPVRFLQNINRGLKKGGMLFLTTPNRDEILMQVHQEKFASFFYRTAHLWYFNEKSLRNISEKAGFQVQELKSFYTYDLSNLLLWLRDGRPTGLGQFQGFDDDINAHWKTYLENKGWADQLLAVLVKV